jgi:hypothetical protein
LQVIKKVEGGGHECEKTEENLLQGKGIIALAKPDSSGGGAGLTASRRIAERVAHSARL